MQTIKVDTRIRAPIERCFDAARDLDLHIRSLAHTNERAVAGRMSGLIELGEEVTWRGRHLGITQHFTSRITAYDRPRHFQDTMQRGAFRTFVHDHYFTEEGTLTRMTDVLAFSAPFGIFGRIAERLVLRRYLTRLLQTRADAIRGAIE
ncbi:MAG TPA: SRPBCC family protein [Thermoanaerobaculia bacterium]|jgi:ligand-binding SRPBCC domain-containing protein|nr:SRPBCC family protein [Thermoanaerobaculia bacterium]